MVRACTDTAYVEGCQRSPGCLDIGFHRRLIALGNAKQIIMRGKCHIACISRVLVLKVEVSCIFAKLPSEIPARGFADKQNVCRYTALSIVVLLTVLIGVLNCTTEALVVPTAGS